MLTLRKCRVALWSPGQNAFLGSGADTASGIYDATFPAILDRLSSLGVAFVEQSLGHVFDFEQGARKRTTPSEVINVVDSSQTAAIEGHCYRQ
jgi:hypothetical protein